MQQEVGPNIYSTHCIKQKWPGIMSLIETKLAKDTDMGVFDYKGSNVWRKDMNGKCEGGELF